MANSEHVEILRQGVEVWNKWREENPDVTPDLTKAALNKAYLIGVNLRRANLMGANLWDARLMKAHITQADLRQTDLMNADLTGANLTDTYLGSANLMYADLTDANMTLASLLVTNFSSTILTRTNFSNASLSRTNFNDVDLSTAKGLESTRHGSPSHISIDTLTLSEGKIPDVFLRGCGVPEDFITYLPSLLANPVEFYSCFISYSHADKAFARQLHDFLQGRGIRCWLDEHQLLPGHDIFEEVDRGIKLWDKVLLCASKDSLTSWWVDNEINSAFKKEQTIMKRDAGRKALALIPLDLDGYIFSDWKNGKAEQVKSRLAADFTGWQTDNDKLQTQFELVLKALRTDGGREAPPQSKL